MVGIHGSVYLGCQLLNRRDCVLLIAEEVFDNRNRYIYVWLVYYATWFMHTCHDSFLRDMKHTNCSTNTTITVDRKGSVRQQKRVYIYMWLVYYVTWLLHMWHDSCIYDMRQRLRQRKAGHVYMTHIISDITLVYVTSHSRSDDVLLIANCYSLRAKLLYM